MENRHPRGPLPLRVLALAMGVVALLSAGCTRYDPKLNRPNLLAVSPDGKQFLILDGLSRILVTDRQFKLVREIRIPDCTHIYGMCTTPQGEIAITNSRSLMVSFTEEERKANAVAEIIFLDFQGNIRRRQEWVGETGPLVHPGQIFVQPDGGYVVTELELNKVVRFDKNGNVLDGFGQYGQDPGQLHLPNDIRAGDGDSYLIVDSYNFRVSKFGRLGDHLKSVGGKGAAEGQLMFPNYSCTDPAGNLYVTELGNMRISVFNSELAFQRCIYPQKEGVTADPIQLFGMAFATNPDEVLVADSINSCLYLFSPQGKLLRTIEAVMP